MRTRPSPLAIVVLLALAGVLVFAGASAWNAFRTFQRAAAPPGAADAARVRDFIPLDAVARRNGVPVAVLLDALRAAGFTAEPQRILPELPPGAGPFRRPQETPTERLLPPEQQSLRQVARQSNRQPSDAVRVVQEAIVGYGPRATPERRAPGGPGGAGAPGRPRPSGGPPP